MYILLGLLGIAVVVWFAVKPGWAPQPPDTSQWTNRAGEVSKQATTRASEASKQAQAKAGEMYQGLSGRFKFHSDTRELAKQFKQWVSEASLSKRVDLFYSMPASSDGFAVWLGGLGDKDLVRFTHKIARFCASLNFDIAWLTDPQVAREPELKKTVEDTVLLYSLAVWRANNVQQEVNSFLAYRAWNTDPNRHKAFGQMLHQILIQRGLVTVPVELYLAPEKERLAHATIAIRKVAEENHAAFQAALCEVAGAGDHAAAGSPAPLPSTSQPTEPSANSNANQAAAEGGVA